MLGHFELVLWTLQAHALDTVFEPALQNSDTPSLCFGHSEPALQTLPAHALDTLSPRFGHYEPVLWTL